MVRLFLPLLVSVKEIKTLEYHNYIEIISGVSYVYEAYNWDKIESNNNSVSKEQNK
jgi:hypothetical protein